MLSWDEFDKEDATEAKAAPAVAQAAAPLHTRRRCMPHGAQDEV